MADYKLSFDSLHSMADYVKSSIAAGKRIEGARADSEMGATPWHGGLDMDDCHDIVLEKGGYWSEGVKAVSNIALDAGFIGSIKKLPVKRAVRAFAGSRPHVPAAIAGANKSMLKSVKRDVFRPVIKLAVTVSGACDVSQDYFYNRGAAILAAIKALESKGYNVELWALLIVKTSSRRNARRFFTKIKIKNAGQHLGIADLSYVFCHCTMTRRYMLALIELTKGAHKCSTDGYGYPQSANASERAEFDITLQSITDVSIWADPITALESIEYSINDQLKKAA